MPLLVFSMRLIFTTRQFQQLHHLDLAQRQQVIQRATMRLTPPERFALNILKLFVYVPAFALLVKLPEQPLNALWAGLILLCIPLIIRPMQWGMAEKYLQLPKQD